MHFGSDKTRAEDGIGSSIQNRLQHFLIFPGIVLQIRVLNQDERRRGHSETGSNSGALAAVDFVAAQNDARITGLKGL